MVLFVDNIPEMWLGRKFEVKLGFPHTIIKIEGVMNGNTLLASYNNSTPYPYLNVQTFAVGLLRGTISQID